jgi:hypothetical protein
MTDGLETIDHGEPMTSRWLLPVGLAVVAALIVGVAVWLGSGPAPDQMAVLDSAGVDTEPEAEPDGADDTTDPGDEVADVVPTVTYEVFLERDPFEPVREPVIEDDTAADDTIVVEPDPDDPSDPDDPAAPSDPSDPSDPRDPSDPGDPSDPRDPAAPAPGGGDRCEGGKGEVVCDGHVVTLQEITRDGGADRAVIQVDTVVYEVGAGERFAERFQLLDIDRAAGSVTGLYGDARFTLREGERTLK